MLSKKVKRIIKAIIFSIVVFIILIVCNFIIQPVWMWDSQYDRIYGFYEEPDNTIETVFLGSSQIEQGISPMELYEKYGICSYNLGTSNQPMLASYYWLEECYRLHSQTLDTVVLDVDMLRFDVDTSWYHIALDPMQFSMVKLRAVKAYSENFTDFLYNIFPILSYHERWTELSFEDFNKVSYEPLKCIRGYHFDNTRWINNVNDLSELRLPILIEDEDTEDTNLVDTAIDYFKKIVSFCEQCDIKLVLIKTPAAWSLEDHNAIQILADSYGLTFMDFNMDLYYDDIDFNFATDVSNPSNVNVLHLNYDGSKKLTDYLGDYLINECENRDIRGDEKYAFMDEELNDYHYYVSFRQSLAQSVDPCDYIEIALEKGDCTIFISVKDDAASSLTEEQRAFFESIGLTELSQLTYGCSYLAVIDDGKVIIEQYQEDPGEENENDDLISYTGTLHNGTSYTIVSGGYHMGNKSSIIIEDTERSSNKRGLNIAVYDNKLQRYVACANFDTWLAPERPETFNEQRYKALMEEGTPFSSLTGENYILYLYNRECENEEIAKIARLEMDEPDGLITYLKAFWDDENIDIFITAQGDVSEVLTSILRTDLSEMGLSELSQLSYSDSYVAAICNGDIMEEELHYSKVPLEVSSDKYSIKSIGREGSDDTSSVIINGTEYEPEQDGIFIVIYDNITEMVVDTITFEPKTDDVYEVGEIAG